MDRTNEFDSSFHHRPTIPYSQHMSSQKTSNQASTFHQTGAPSSDPSKYLPVNEDEVYDEYDYDEVYEKPYSQQYQPGRTAGQSGQGGRSGQDHRLNSFVDSFESIN